ncbi:hypothetical protein [Polluticoccus soli]|uniref:hypothetical protein n=1 Tax=Polluticoccus soli TaxID=3034150 RepID=UPI0023E223C0|nr:hypothetical protein [Flavipsychrobacter sp. JY13-12]
MVGKFSLFLVLFVFAWSASYSQRAEYSDKCELVHNLLDSADQTFFDFSDGAKDSSITILDVNGVLKECSMNTVGNLKLIIINSGEEVERIRKQGIFSAARRQNSYVFTKERLGELTGFRVFHPVSNGSFYWGFSERDRRYIFQKKSCGWF